MSTFNSERPDDIPEKVWRQLTALMARAAHPNTPAPEAELCNEQVQRLMIKWQITDAMAADTQKQPTVIIEEDIKITGKNTTHKGILLNRVAAVFNCKVISFRDYGKSAITDYNIIGRKQDIAMAWTLFEHLLIQLNAQLAGLPLRGTPASYQQNYRKGFIVAFASRVSARLEEMYKEEIEASGTGTELVLANIKDAVDNFMNEQYPDLGKAKSVSAGSLRGQMDGIDAADKADIFLPGARFDATQDKPALDKVSLAIGS